MSGGRFDYNQSKIGYIADEIQDILNKQGKEKGEDLLRIKPEHFKKYPEDKVHPTFQPFVQAALLDAVKFLRIAHIFANRADSFLSGDDGDKTFVYRLKNELDNLKKEMPHLF